MEKKLPTLREMRIATRIMLFLAIAFYILPLIAFIFFPEKADAGDLLPLVIAIIFTWGWWGMKKGLKDIDVMLDEHIAKLRKIVYDEDDYLLEIIQEMEDGDLKNEILRKIKASK